MNRLSPSWWGRMPREYAWDKRLGAIHFRILIIMSASVHKGSNVTKIGQRLIARDLGISQPTVNRRQAELAEWGLIKQQDRENGKRVAWEMLSPAFQNMPAPAMIRRSSVRRGAGRGGVTETTRKAASVATLTRDEVAELLA